MFNKNPVVDRFRVWSEKNIRPLPLGLAREAPPPNSIWKTLATETNLFKMIAPEALGGEALGMAEMSSALYGLALGGMDVAIASSFAAHSAIGADLLLKFGTPAQIAKYLPSIFDGSRIAAICNSEENTGTDIRKIKSHVRTSESGKTLLTTTKGCVTNASIADLLFVSAWNPKGENDKSIDVFLVEGSEIDRQPINHLLGGFRTGWTGKIHGVDIPLVREERIIGEKVGGFRIFRRCFNLERLYMAVMVSGILEGLENDARKALATREANGSGIAAHQYIQEKIVQSFATRTKMNAIIETIVNAGDARLGEFERELGVLKLLIMEDAFDTANAHFEMMGYRSYLEDELPQKIIRDMLALRFFGGTKELQKMTIFQAIVHGDNDRKLKAA